MIKSGYNKPLKSKCCKLFWATLSSRRVEIRLRKICSQRCRFTQNWVFLHTLFLENEAQIDQFKTITERCLSCQNKSVCQKLARSCKKMKMNEMNQPKKRYTPFLHEGLQLHWMPSTRKVYESIVKSNVGARPVSCCIAI